MHRSMPTRRRAAAVAAAVVLLLSPGCGAPPAPTVTVEGRLVMGPDLPVAGMLVHAQGQLVTSDGDGRFVLNGIATPYTLTVASTGTPPWAHVYEGLTAATPVLAPAIPQAPWALPAFYRTARVTGATPNANPLPPGQRLEVCVSGVDAVVIGCDTVVAGGASYDLDAVWWVPRDVDVRLHGLLLLVDANDQPTGVLGYGTLPLVLTANATLVQLAPSGPPPTSVPLQGAIAVAGGGVLQSVRVGVRVDGQVIAPLVSGPPTGPSVGFVAPEVDPPELLVVASGTFAAGGGYTWALVDPGAPFTVSLPAPSQQLAPLDGATSVTSATPFTLVGDADRVHQFAWQQAGVPDGLTVHLLTRRSSVTLPDLAPVGLAWTAGGTYGWRVSTWSLTNVDDAASLGAQGAGFELLLGYGIGVDGDGWITGSGQRTATLAP